MFASGENRDLGHMIGCPGAWTLTIRQAGDALALVVSSGGHLRTVAISDEPALWADGRLDIDAGGSSLVVIPQRKRAWGSCWR